MSKLLERLDQTRIGGLHRRSAWAAGLGIFLDGYDLSIIAVALIRVDKSQVEEASLVPPAV